MGLVPIFPLSSLFVVRVEPMVSPPNKMTNMLFNHGFQIYLILKGKYYGLFVRAIYGFLKLTGYFLEKHPGYFMSPLRVSGSAVETLFGQYKYVCLQARCFKLPYMQILHITVGNFTGTKNKKFQ